MKEISVEDFKKLLSSIQKNDGDKVIQDILLPKKSNFPVNIINDISFDNVNFNSPMWGSTIFRRKKIYNCKFVNCNFDGSNIKKIDFKDCSFKDSVVGEKLITSFHSCEFTNCNFDGCTISLLLSKCKLIDCKFISNNISKIKIEESVTTKLKFVGSLNRVSFGKCEVNDIDFSEAHLTDCGFVFCKEQNIIYPNKPDNFAVRASLFQDIKTELKKKLQQVSYNNYCELADIISKNENKTICVDINTFYNLTPEDREVVLNELYKLNNSKSASN